MEKPTVTTVDRTDLLRLRQATQVHHQHPRAPNRAYNPHVHLRVWEAKLDRKRMIEVTGGPEGRGGSGLINYDGKSRSSVRC